MRTSHDLIVLGAGSGGLATALRAAQHGARVALLDPEPLGGTCVHRGCLPKKAFWFAAQWAQAQQLAGMVGFTGQPGSLDWARFCAVRQHYVDAIQLRYARRLQEGGVLRVQQAGHFVASDTVELADGSRLQAPHVVIATGARPRRLPLPGFDLGLVSDDMFVLQAVPERVVIVGGGYIAMEFAGLLRALGSEVAVLAHGGLLQSFDTELVQALAEHMRLQGIGVTLDSDVRAVRRTAAGLVLDDSTAATRGACDVVLWAIGRVPATSSLGLDMIGVRVDPAGHVLTDAYQNTNVAGVHALGDVTPRKALTPIAVAVGRALADRLFAGRTDAKLDYANIPSVVFADPPLGMVGFTEAQARAMHGAAVRVYRSQFAPMQWALAGKPGRSVMKVVCVGADERVVGIHVLGPGADEMLQGFALALKRGVCKRDLDATVAIHPTSAEELVLMS